MVWYAFNVASKIDSKGVDQGTDLVEWGAFRRVLRSPQVAEMDFSNFSCISRSLLLKRSNLVKRCIY